MLAGPLGYPDSSKGDSESPERLNPTSGGEETTSFVRNGSGPGRNAGSFHICPQHAPVFLKTCRRASGCCRCHAAVIVPYRGQSNQGVVQTCPTLRKRISLSQQLSSTARPQSTSQTRQRASWPSPHVEGTSPCSGASSGRDAKQARAGRGNARLLGQEEAPGR